MILIPRSLAALAAFALTGCAAAQRADRDFHPAIEHPVYAAASGPTVWIDEAHHNVVATSGRYEPLVAALRADGYTVRALRSPFEPGVLKDVRLLLIGNALAPGTSTIGPFRHPPRSRPRRFALSTTGSRAAALYCS